MQPTTIINDHCLGLALEMIFWMANVPIPGEMVLFIMRAIRPIRRRNSNVHGIYLAQNLTVGQCLYMELAVGKDKSRPNQDRTFETSAAYEVYFPW